MEYEYSTPAAFCSFASASTPRISTVWTSEPSMRSPNVAARADR